MVERSILLNAREITWITSKYVEAEAEDEGRAWLKTVRKRGLSPTKDEMLNAITLKCGIVYRSIMAILYDIEICGFSRGPLFFPAKDGEEVAMAIQFCAFMRDIKEAVGLYLRLVRYEIPDFETHYALLQGVCRWGDAEDIEAVGKIIEVMLRGGSKVSGKSCVHIMEGFVRHGMKSEGMRILKLVGFYGIGPNKRDIDQALKDKPVEIRLSVLEALDDKGGLTLKPPPFFPLINQGQWNLALSIQACLFKGDIKEAVELYLRLVRSEIPDFITHYMFLHYVCRSGDAEDVTVVGKVIEAMSRGGSKLRWISCVVIMEGFVRLGMRNEGLRILELVKFYGIGPDKEDLMREFKDKSIGFRLSVLAALDVR